MRRPPRSLLLLSLALGCGGSSPPPRPAPPTAPAATPAPAPPPPVVAEPAVAPPADNPVVVELAALADRACACADAACADTVQRDFMQFISEHADERGEAGDRKKVEASAERMMRCIMERQASGSTGVAPAPAVDEGRVRAPIAADLATYTADLPGTGALVATLETSHGKIRCTLDEAAAPIAVANFVGLARGLHPYLDPVTRQVSKAPFYDGTVFHRVIAGFMVQGGDRLGTGAGGPGYTFVNEVAAGRSHDRAGVLSMANRGPDTNGSQFFIIDAPAQTLDGGYTIFGQCQETKVVRRIARVEVGPSPGGESSSPVAPVRLERVTIARSRR